MKYRVMSVFKLEPPFAAIGVIPFAFIACAFSGAFGLLNRREKHPDMSGQNSVHT